jgi:hypothetical protein
VPVRTDEANGAGSPNLSGVLGNPRPRYRSSRHFSARSESLGASPDNACAGESHAVVLGKRTLPAAYVAAFVFSRLTNPMRSTGLMYMRGFFDSFESNNDAGPS